MKIKKPGFVNRFESFDSKGWDMIQEGNKSQGVPRVIPGILASALPGLAFGAAIKASQHFNRNNEEDKNIGNKKYEKSALKDQHKKEKKTDNLLPVIAGSTVAAAMIFNSVKNKGAIKGMQSSLSPVVKIAPKEAEKIYAKRLPGGEFLSSLLKYNTKKKGGPKKMARVIDNDFEKIAKDYYGFGTGGKFNVKKNKHTGTTTFSMKSKKGATNTATWNTNKFKAETGKEIKKIPGNISDNLTKMIVPAAVSLAIGRNIARNFEPMPKKTKQIKEDKNFSGTEKMAAANGKSMAIVPYNGQKRNVQLDKALAHKIGVGAGSLAFLAVPSAITALTGRNPRNNFQKKREIVKAPQYFSPSPVPDTSFGVDNIKNEVEKDKDDNKPGFLKSKEKNGKKLYRGVTKLK